jgi:hypothetical protein
VADIEWKGLPALWPSPAEFADVGELMLLVFTQNGARQYGRSAGGRWRETTPTIFNYRRRL